MITVHPLRFALHFVLRLLRLASEEQPSTVPEPAAFDKDALKRLAQKAADGTIEEPPPPPPEPKKPSAAVVRA